MIWLKNLKYIIVILLLLLSCSKKSETVDKLSYQNKISEWKAYLKEIGFDVKQEDLKNTVILVVHSSECAPCLQELNWWNNNVSSLVHTKVKLIVIEKHIDVYEAFLTGHDLKLEAYRDSTGLVIEKQLVPNAPSKIYFDKNLKIKDIQPIGAYGNLNLFLKEVKG